MPETPAEREQDRKEGIASKKAGAAASDAEAKAEASTTAGKGLGTQESIPDKSAFPKQTAGESPASYSARIKAWRDSHSATKQMDALGKASKDE